MSVCSFWPYVDFFRKPKTNKKCLHRILIYFFPLKMHIVQLFFHFSERLYIPRVPLFLQRTSLVFMHVPWSFTTAQWIFKCVNMQEDGCFPPFLHVTAVTFKPMSLHTSGFLEPLITYSSCFYFAVIIRLLLRDLNIAHAWSLRDQQVNQDRDPGTESENTINAKD